MCCLGVQGESLLTWPAFPLVLQTRTAIFMFLFKKLIHALTVLASTLHEAMDLESSSSWACQKIKNKQVSCANTMHFLN